MTGEKKDARPSGSGDVDTQLVASRYEIQELLGRGSMGAVYCARDVVLDREVALKLFPTESADAQQAVRYEQEARLLARLSHPGLVTVYDAGIDATVASEPKPYLVMELVRGTTLADRLRDGALPAPEVSALAAQLASALAHIHRREVVHRDVKPANIILRADAGDYPTATLTDFGIARLIDGTRLTMTGFAVGTANYLSPEQLTGGEVGPPSDIYSLGLVLLECLTGELAYPGHGAEAAMPRLQGSPEIPESLPEGWRELLQAMTRLEPEARPAAAEITTYLGGLTDAPTSAMQLPAVAPPDDADADHTRVLSVPEMTQLSAPRPSSRRHLLKPGLLMAALAAALVLIFIIAYVASGDSGNSSPTVPLYPSVGGQIGDHLHQLQQDVAP
jgi:serine/threonine protein kinase